MYSVISLIRLICLKIKFAAFAIAIAGHIINTPSPQEFKSRLKGQVVCYSCLAFIRDHTSQQSSRIYLEFSTNVTDLYKTLQKGGLIIPKYSPNCAEIYSFNVPNYYGVDLVFCPNTVTEAGACVKLKGHYNGDQYIYRNCWNNMWIDKRPYARQMSERCYTDELVQNFVATTNNKICFCEDDLCNGSNAIVIYNYYPRLLALFVIILCFSQLHFL
ncbi:unnamed protein product [Thelazia callipaeda]|uniref:Protein quiver n=1 Tax=Thelazia callipaeda TaxID=103827 RepID=A0A0N5CXZ8_THECL|nr:unnamed protein product [Thelazia callipaeda]